MNKTYKLIIIGGGPAGIMSAITAAKFKCSSVLLLEKNKSLARKLLLTGKGRCNFTNSADINKFVKVFEDNNHFYNSIFKNFFNLDLIDFLKTIDIYPVEDSEGRIFPQEGGAELILKNLSRLLDSNKIKISFSSHVEDIKLIDSMFCVICRNNIIFNCRNLIIATGGLSYPSTGSTGDGYVFAKKIGHQIVKPYPSLVPLISNNESVNLLKVISLKNIVISVINLEKDKKKYFTRGDLIFTHYGISGPAVLDISGKVYNELYVYHNTFVSIDMIPDLSIEILYDKFLLYRKQNSLKELKSFFKIFKIPEKIIAYILDYVLKIGAKKIANISKSDFLNIATIFKEFKLKITATEDFKKAMVTSGGISFEEINPKTMQSLLTPGLYFAGEIIEKSGPTGGYNLQKAFSTGYIAGKSAALKILDESFV